MVAREPQVALRGGTRSAAALFTAAALVALCVAAAPVNADSQKQADRVCVRRDALSASGTIEIVRAGKRLYGCVRETQRGVLLAVNDEPWSTWGRIASAGPMAAIEIRQGGKDAGSRRILVVDVVRQRMCQETPAGTGTAGAPPTPDQPPAETAPGRGEPITSLTVTRAGAVAFIAGPGYGPYSPGDPSVAPWSGYEVVASDAEGARQLDAGTDVAPRSLSRSGRTVRWRSADMERSVTLSGTNLKCRGRFWL